MIEDGKIVEIDYVNHRGERTGRRVYPVRWDWHAGVGWVMQAIDLTHPPGADEDCGADRLRCFAMSGVVSWRSSRSAEEQAEAKDRPSFLSRTVTGGPVNREAPPPGPT